MSTVMEDYPALPITEQKFKINRRSKSRGRSSVSTTSIGATEPELQCRVARGDYIIMNGFNLRQSLTCLPCNTCKRHKFTTASNFDECEEAFYFDRDVFRCTVTNSKVIRHRTGDFSVSYITTNLDMIDPNTGEAYLDGFGRKVKVEGWVKSKHLRKPVSTSKSAEPAVRRNEREVDRSRSSSVVYTETPFQFRDLVLVNPDGNKWVRGEVHKTSPLLIQVEGERLPLPFHISQIKDHPTRQFRAVRDLTVRRNKYRGDEAWGDAETIKAGETLKIAYMDGCEGRIVAPFQGWITMRDSVHSSLNVVEADWKYNTSGKIQPSIIVSNLPGTLTEESLRRHLRFECYMKPKTIAFQRKGEEVRAVVTFANHFNALRSLVQKGTSEFAHGWNITFQWNMAYWKNLALHTLLHPPKPKKQTKRS